MKQLTNQALSPGQTRMRVDESFPKLLSTIMKERKISMTLMKNLSRFKFQWEHTRVDESAWEFRPSESESFARALARIWKVGVMEACLPP